MEVNEFLIIIGLPCPSVIHSMTMVADDTFVKRSKKMHLSNENILGHSKQSRLESLEGRWEMRTGFQKQSLAWKVRVVVQRGEGAQKCKI